MAVRKKAARLQVRGFAQIDDVDLALGDLTVLVGPQASGKSLALQLLKLAIDGRAVAHTSRSHDLLFNTREEFLERYFGEGAGRMWTDATTVQWNGKKVDLDKLVRGRKSAGQSAHSMYFIPAHRSLTLANGYPLAFQQLTNETPFVVRMFSEHVRELLIQNPSSEPLFSSKQRRLKPQVRAKLDDAIFHGATLHDDSSGTQRRLLLSAGEQRLSYMTWTAGQRELIPLLLGSYFLLPSGKGVNRTDWVVIEEPEMGLHPRGISAVILLVLDFLSHGYKVVLSTHAPLVLDLVWAIQRLKRAGASWQSVLALFGIEGATKSKAPGEALVASEALTKDYRVYMFDFDERQRVKSFDISSLDPSSEDGKTAGWGDLTGLSGHIASVVADAVNAAKRKPKARRGP